MRSLLLLLWLGTIGLLQAVTIVTDLPETVMPFTMQAEEPNDAAEVESADFSVQEDETPDTRHLYATLVEKPERLFKGEIVSIVIRTVITTDLFDDLSYRFSGGSGLSLLSDSPERERQEHTYLDRFYFKVTGKRALLPDITPVLTLGYGEEESSAPIQGGAIEATVLNPPKNFCGILADRFAITHVKTTVYDKGHNIIVISADANRSDLRDFHLSEAGKQDFESLQINPHFASMSYYAVLPKTVEVLRFQYFNLQNKRYERISIPIEVDDDLVSTTSDINPIEHGHVAQKTIIFLVLFLLFFLLALWKRSWTLLAVGIAAGGYAAWLNIPLQQVCIKEGAPIYLLPMRNATVFEITPQRHQLDAEGHSKGYTKIRLQNDQIGWVKNEDTCAD
ncbi:hypothetical protein [Sulfurimonas diazotrophicus]|uniref:SH3 domain-containing protein n=1 Tax=Sulfurimonas diazotrophicus TaxID=3131939 RepID=A0ABZ3H930_9BACT